MNVVNSGKRPSAKEAAEAAAKEAAAKEAAAEKAPAEKAPAWEGTRAAAVSRGVTRAGLTPLYAIHDTTIGDVIDRIAWADNARRPSGALDDAGEPVPAAMDDGSPSVKAAVAILKALSKGAALADILALAIVEAEDVGADRKAVKSAQIRAAATKASTGKAGEHKKAAKK